MNAENHFSKNRKLLEIAKFTVNKFSLMPQDQRNCKIFAVGLTFLTISCLKQISRSVLSQGKN